MQREPLKQTKYADHLRACAELTNEIAKLMDLREDSARQACFATLIISSDRHGVFMEPIDQNGPTQGTNGSTAAKVQPATKTPSEGEAKDREAAAKADAQINSVDPESTAEKAETATREALLTGIQSAVKLLNDEGHVPTITAGGLNALIKKTFPGKAQLGGLDIEELEGLIKLLSDRVDKLREKKKADDDVGF